jgi:Tfp pilus assembly protein PilX
MRRHHLHSEEGFVLATSIVLMAIMVTVALASYSFVDTGQKRTRDQRERETSLNVTEGVLYSQGFALAQKWPGNLTQGNSMPATCTQTAQVDPALAAFCPVPGTLAAANGSPATANFATFDALSNVTWTTKIRDNGPPAVAGQPDLSVAFVSSAADAAQAGTNVRTGLSYSCPGPCKWDANGDRQLWVQARGVVRGKPRNLVALLKREVFAEAFPRNGVVAGSFETTNKGNKGVIDSTGSQVVVRCLTTDPNCTLYDAGKEQVLPPTIVHNTAYPPAMTPTQLARFKNAAQTASPPTYYTSCPDTYTGTVVYIDVPATTVCSDTNNATYNSKTDPGIVIMPRGRMDNIKGTYFALLYLGNEQNSDGPVLTLAANSQVCGGVAIDGPGRLVAGEASNAASICDPTRGRATVMFQENAFNSLASFGTTGLVQNTWRELPPAA